MPSTDAPHPHPLDFDTIEHVTAREYLRVSHDESGRKRSNEEQHDDNVRAVEHKRWQLGEPYEDVGSASRYQRKRRPGFDQLVADIEGGSFGAHVLIIWENSRGSRKVSEWSRLLEACETFGVRVYVTNDRALYDPRVARDWRSLMSDAVDSEHEVRKTSGRVKRSSSASATSGSYHGGHRPYGFTNGKDHEPEEAKMIRTWAQWVIDGRTAYWIADHMNELGTTTPRGNAWQAKTITDLLLAPRIAGKRSHHDVIVADAQWKPILDETTWRRVCAVLASRAPVARRGRKPRLLTGLLRCHCGAALISSGSEGARRRYVCRARPGSDACGTLTVVAPPLEELLGDQVMLRLADAQTRASVDVDDDDDADERAQLDEIATKRVETMDDYAGGLITRADRVEQLAALDRRRRAVDASIAAKVRASAPALVDFVVAEGYVGRSWASLDDTERRLVLEALIERVEIGRTRNYGSNKFDSSRVTVVWRV